MKYSKEMEVTSSSRSRLLTCPVRPPVPARYPPAKPSRAVAWPTATVNVFPQISEWRYEGIVLLFCLDVERLRREQFWPGLPGVANDEPSSESVEFARPTDGLDVVSPGVPDEFIIFIITAIQSLKMMLLSAFLVLALLGGVNGQPTATYVNEPEATLATRSNHARTHARAPRSLQRRPYLQRRGGQRC